MKKQTEICVLIVATLMSFGAVNCDRKISNENNRLSTPSSAASESDRPSAGAASTVNGKTLDPKMSDPEMLAVFGMQHSKATSKRSQGPDGYTTTYTEGDQNVSITHSAVTGVNVIAWGPIRGDWLLGKP